MATYSVQKTQLKIYTLGIQTGTQYKAIIIFALWNQGIFGSRVQNVFELFWECMRFFSQSCEMECNMFSFHPLPLSISVKKLSFLCVIFMRFPCWPADLIFLRAFMVSRCVAEKWKLRERSCLSLLRWNKPINDIFINEVCLTPTVLLKPQRQSASGLSAPP